MVVPSPSPSAELPPSPTAHALKRRRTSSVTEDSKRQRISPVDPEEPTQTAIPVPDINSPSITERAAARRAVRLAKEDGRNKRLFGGLLGTLSRPQQSAGDQRRADIERKQRVKLKEQEETATAAQKSKLEELRATRFKEQKFFDEEAVR